MVKTDDQTIRARMGTMKDQLRFEKLVDKAVKVYSSIGTGKHDEVPTMILKNARCIAILPDVKTGALVVGGTHGEGLASCKTSDNTWSQLAPISINQGSIGLQAGAKSADLVLYFQNKKAERALKKGNLKLGTDVSVVAGKFDSTSDTSSESVVAYTHSKGLFAGASINGSRIGRDQSEILRYYGKNVGYADLLESPQSSGYATKLTKLFPE